MGLRARRVLKGTIRAAETSLRESIVTTGGGARGDNEALKLDGDDESSQLVWRKLRYRMT